MRPWATNRRAAALITGLLAEAQRNTMSSDIATPASRSAQPAATRHSV